MKQYKTTDFVSDNQPSVLVVTDFESQVRFYKEHVGLLVNAQDDESVILGVNGDDFIRLNRQALSNDHTDTVAFCVPNRRELARVTARLCTVKRLIVAVDRGYRQSVYLMDCAGNEIEIYVNTPEKASREIPSTGISLDLEALFNELLPDDRLCDGMPVGTVKGEFIQNNPL